MPAPVTGALASAATQPAKDPQHAREVAKAARQFEGVLLQQVLKVLWKTTPTMGGHQGEMYQQMFEGPFAEQLAASGGIGLASMLTRALESSAGGSGKAEELATVHRFEPAAGIALAASAQAGGFAGASQIADGGIGPLAAFTDPGVGESAQVQLAAADMLREGGAQWSKDGTLQPQDLQSHFVTETATGQAHFSVRDARGYAGYYKCNLFAFELARRAGFEVPVVPRDAGWGFPSANRVTQDASDKELDGSWARVATGESAASLDSAISSGQRAFMLTGSGADGAHGHMAVVEHVRSVDYGKNGEIRRIVFDGWEARPQGASHLTSRTWNMAGNPGGTSAHDGFGRIEILELKRPAEGAAEVPLSVATKPSALDDSPSSASVQRPKSRSEDKS